MWIVIGVGVILLIFVGLFLRAGGRIIALEYEDFPQSELEKLLQPEGAPPQELRFSGSLKVEARSRWTRWAIKLFPGHFMIDAKLGGQKVTLVLDTGAALTVLSPDVAVAAQATLVAEGPETVHWGQPIPTYLGYVHELEVAGLKAHHVPVLVLGKRPILKLLGLPAFRVEGLLGMSVLEKIAVTLDGRTGAVILSQEPLSLDAPSASLRLFEQELQGFRVLSPIVDGFLDGVGPHMAVIDTASSFAEILISDELLLTLGWQDREEIPIRLLQLGGIELRDVLAVPARKREAKGVKLRGSVMLIGNGLFQAQGFKRLTLDFLGSKLYAER